MNKPRITIPFFTDNKLVYTSTNSSIPFKDKVYWDRVGRENEMKHIVQQDREFLDFLVANCDIFICKEKYADEMGHKRGDEFNNLAETAGFIETGKWDNFLLDLQFSMGFHDKHLVMFVDPTKAGILSKLFDVTIAVHMINDSEYSTSRITDTEYFGDFKTLNMYINNMICISESEWSDYSSICTFKSIQ